MTEFGSNSREFSLSAGQAGLAPGYKIRYIISSRPAEPLSLTSLIPAGFCFSGAGR